VSDLPIPDLRSGPPWVMEEMMAMEPGLAEAIAAQGTAADAIAGAARRALNERASVSIVGCGTSEHAAMAVAILLGEAAARQGMRAGSIVARQAFEAALEPWPNGLTIGISHEGETPATVAALAAARSQGAETALVTANPAGPAAAAADHVLSTPQLDRSWCHTVGYASPMVAGASIAAALEGTTIDGAALANHLRAVLDLAPAAEAVAASLWGVDRLVICGSGLDSVSARELALKVEEGVHLPAVGRDVETELHGHLVSADAACGLVAIVTDPRQAGPRAERTDQLLLAAQRQGMPTGVIVAEGMGEGRRPGAARAGHVRLPATGPRLEPVLAALAGSAIALQLLTVGLIHRAGTNPDRIRREDATYREAAEIASASFPT
jgi:glutamine---fructose-6-phosphate transaminase (isomerizing)